MRAPPLERRDNHVGGKGKKQHKRRRGANEKNEGGCKVLKEGGGSHFGKGGCPSPKKRGGDNHLPKAARWVKRGGRGCTAT